MGKTYRCLIINLVPWSLLMLFLSFFSICLKSLEEVESLEDILHKCLNPEYLSETKENKNSILSLAAHGCRLVFRLSGKIKASPNVYIAKYPVPLIFCFFSLCFSYTGGSWSAAPLRALIQEYLQISVFICCIGFYFKGGNCGYVLCCRCFKSNYLQQDGRMADIPFQKLLFFFFSRKAPKNFWKTCCILYLKPPQQFFPLGFVRSIFK